MLALTRNPHIPLRLRKKIGKCCPVKPGRSFRIGIFGQDYEGTTGIHMDDKIYLYGLHEAATVRLMRDLLKKQQNPVYLDVGTNAGMHLVAVADLAAQVYGFEPWESVRARAQHNIAINNLTHAKLFPFGLSDCNAALPFKPPVDNNLGVGSFVESAGANTLSLQVRKGDDVMREHNIRPTLIKMDIEGHEHKALAGLRDTLRECKPAVVFEYIDAGRETLGNPETLRSLFGPGYEFFGIKRSRETPALEPFNPAKKYENVLAVFKG